MKYLISCKNGFSLVELLIAVAVIGILCAIAIPAYKNYVTSAKQKSAESILEQFPVLLEQYRAENGSFPPNGTYSYSETAAGVATDTITPILPAFRPRPATYPANQGILFNYSLTITNSGTATEQAAFSATGVREAAGINVSGTYN